jgi:RimJ/RimL family protein N-acetyltransferase
MISRMLLGERIRLRRPEREDLPRFRDWLNDPQVRRHLALVYPMGLSHEEQWWEDQLRLEPAAQAYVIEARREPAEWASIGVVGFHGLDWRNRSVECGLFIGERAVWDAGYGTDTMRTVARFAFLELNLNRIFLKVYEDNERAIRCYQKVGFQIEGRLRQDCYQDGRYLDTVVMGLLRHEFPG